MESMHYRVILTFDHHIITITLKMLPDPLLGNYKWQLLHIVWAYQPNIALVHCRVSLTFWPLYLEFWPLPLTSCSQILVWSSWGVFSINIVFFNMNALAGVRVGRGGEENWCVGDNILPPGSYPNIFCFFLFESHPQYMRFGEPCLIWKKTFIKCINKWRRSDDIHTDQPHIKIQWP